MWSILKGEWRKLRRCQILLVGIVALALCPVVQYGTQLIINPEMRDQNFDFVKLFANVIWGNTQIFLPISLVMIGGWLIDRENTNDTMKNLLTVPVSYPKLLGGKLIVTIFLSILFGIYSVAVTVLTGTLAGLDGLSAAVLLRQGVQLVAAAFNTSLVCMPMRQCGCRPMAGCIFRSTKFAPPWPDSTAVHWLARPCWHALAASEAPSWRPMRCSVLCSMPMVASSCRAPACA